MLLQIRINLFYVNFTIYFQPSPATSADVHLFKTGQGELPLSLGYHHSGFDDCDNCYYSDSEQQGLDVSQSWMGSSDIRAVPLCDTPLLPVWAEPEALYARIRTTLDARRTLALNNGASAPLSP